MLLPLSIRTRVGARQAASSRSSSAMAAPAPRSAGGSASSGARCRTSERSPSRDCIISRTTRPTRSARRCGHLWWACEADGSPREFDVDSALERAMDVFWSKGYEATSLDDLCSATGLSRSSLYATFGNKRELLLQTVDRYVEQRTPRIEAILERFPNVSEGIAALLQEFIHQIVSGAGRRGCFLGNCPAARPRRD